MTPSENVGQGSIAEKSIASPAVSFCVSTMRHRPEFLRAASARRQGAGGFLVQARYRNDGKPSVQVGFTASKKVGNAVLRNRSKRRLREVARAILPKMAQPGWDYVLVARPGVTADRPFATLLTDLEPALHAIHKVQL
ncbi:MAG: ribonuclease P protein component [Paracoccaceae bacterium]